jgi:hypothetical protein
MVNLLESIWKMALLRSFVVIAIVSESIAAHTSKDKCRPAVIPIENEPPAKILIEPTLAEPLASPGVVVIQYCTDNLQSVPVYGAKA